MRIAAHCFLGFGIVAGAVGLLATHAADSGPWSSTVAAGRPMVVIDRTQWDFGSLPVGEDLNATFSISNNGSKRLILLDQSQCCGSDEQDVIVPPGETKDIHVSIPTKSHPPGLHRKVVRYETNDRDNRELILTMVFDLRPNSSE